MINSQNKVAIVHDYIKEYGGAEKVLETLLEIYPNAHIYTTFFSPSFLGPHRQRFEKLNIHTTWFQKIPFKNKLLSYFRLIAPLVFKNIDLSDYDIIITSATGTYTSPNFIKKNAKAKLICYCHTPPRYLYGYATAAAWKNVWWRKILLSIGQIPLHFLRLLDFKAAQRVDFFIANSLEVSERIKKFYRRESVVIYPPVDINIKSQQLSKSKDKFYLTGGRLARPKHIDLAVLACTELSLPLKIFGREFSGYGSELKKIAGKSIEFLGEIDNSKKAELYSRAKAFIFSSEDEDFGIMPVEAMSYGTPVIAYKSGGVKETVVDSKTGIFFDTLTKTSLINAIRKFEKTEINFNDCLNQAEKFSKENFKVQIKKFVSSKS